MGAVHPAAALQATDAGKTIMALSLIDGRVYAGYGDYNANTGPIHIESVDATEPLGAWTDHVTADTEQVVCIRAISGDRILVPHLDPQTGGAAGYAERTGGTWTDQQTRITASGGIHVFDAVEHAGSLWACGAVEVEPTPTADGQAVVWRSTDGGATWTESLRDPIPSPAARYYFMAPVGDALWVRNPTSDVTYAWTAADGWAEQSTGMLPPGVQGGPGVAWGDGYLIPSTVRVSDSTVDVYYFDGAASARRRIEIGVLAWDVADDGAMYVLASTGVVFRRASPGAPRVKLPILVADAFDYRTMCVLPGSTEAVLGSISSRLGLIPLA